MTSTGTMMHPIPLLVVTLLLLESTSPLLARDVSFRDDVTPILRNHCLQCHGQDKQKGGLDLSSFTTTLAGGSGGEVVLPGDPSGSRLYQVVAHESEPFMPPNQPRLGDAELATLRAWIEGGLIEAPGGKQQEIAKPAVDLTLKASGDDFDGPPPMPVRLSKEPCVVSSTGRVTALASSPRAPLVALGTDRQILLYNSATTDLEGILPFPEGLPTSLSFTPDGRLLFAAGGVPGRSGRATLFDVTDGTTVVQLGDELDQILAAGIARDLSQAAIGGVRRKVKRIATADGSTLQTIDKHTDWVTAIAFSPDGVLLATADRSGNIYVWEAFSGLEYLTLEPHKGSVTSISWRVDSNVLATASEDGTVRLFEMAAGKQVASFRPHPTGVLSVDFTDDGQLLTAGRDGRVRLHDTAGKKVRDFPPMSDIATAARSTDGGKRVVGVDWGGNATLFDRQTGSVIAALDSSPGPIARRLELAREHAGELEALAAAARDRLDHAEGEARRVRGEHASIVQARTASQASLTDVASELAKGKVRLEEVVRERDAKHRDVVTQTAAIDAAQRSLDAAKIETKRAADRVEFLSRRATWKREIVQHLDLAATSIALADKPVAGSNYPLVTTANDVRVETLRERTVIDLDRADALDLLNATEKVAVNAEQSLLSTRADVAATRARIQQLDEERDQLALLEQTLTARIDEIVPTVAAAIRDETVRAESLHARESIVATARAEAEQLGTEREFALRDVARWQAEDVLLRYLVARDVLQQRQAENATVELERSRAASVLAGAREQLNDARWELDSIPSQNTYRRQRIECDEQLEVALSKEIEAGRVDEEDANLRRTAITLSMQSLRDGADNALDDTLLQEAAAKGDELLAILTERWRVMVAANQEREEALMQLRRRRKRIAEKIAVALDSIPNRRNQLALHASDIDDALTQFTRAQLDAVTSNVRLASARTALQRLDSAYQQQVARATGKAVDVAGNDADRVKPRQLPPPSTRPGADESDGP